MTKEGAAHWRCVNRDCNFFMVLVTTEERDAAPRCICGGEMRKTAAAPVPNYLDFLRSDTAASKEAGMDRK